MVSRTSSIATRKENLRRAETESVDNSLKVCVSSAGCALSIADMVMQVKKNTT